MSKVVSRRDIGSANPFVKFFRELGQSIKGIVTGILFIIISFVVVYFMANLKEHSKTIADLPVLTPQEAEGMNEMVQVQGEPSYSRVVVAPFTEKDALYYSWTTEEYAIREVHKTRQYEEDGRTIEEEYIDYEPKWESVDSESKWSDFSLGNIEIDPAKATRRFNTTTFYEQTEDLEYDASLPDERLVDVPQKRRETVVGVPSESTIIVVGENSNNTIASGQEGTFFVSNMSPSEFLQAQQKSEKFKFWLMAGIAWFLMATGFTMLFGPITHLLNIIPGLGDLAHSLLFIIFGIISAIIVFIAFVGFKFWWAILVLVLAFLGFQIYRKVKKNEMKKPAGGGAGEAKSEEK